MRLLLANSFFASLLAGMLVVSALRLADPGHGLRRARWSESELQAAAARLQAELEAVRGQQVYLFVDAGARRLALACRGTVLWECDVECSSPLAAAIDSDPALRRPQRLCRAHAPEQDSVRVPAQDARTLARYIPAGMPASPSPPTAAAAESAATPTAASTGARASNARPPERDGFVLEYDDLRLRLEPPLPRRESPSRLQILRERAERIWLAKLPAAQAPAQAERHAEIVVRLDLDAAAKVCASLAPGSLLVLRP